ncbi:MAG: DUF3152 domain-containing protein [Actinomycetota bacterium]|nr:DUF3152 domain-containing protein [Actinomycetota bacterium]
MLRRVSLVLGLLMAAAVVPAGAAPAVEYRFSVATRGPVGSDVEAFAATVTRVLADPRGWALDGRVRFIQVGSDGDFTVWLTAASAMRSFGPPCHPRYSCRSGRNVVINEDRWTAGAEPWAGPLEEYRTMVVNHETGHWLGFGHATCTGSGQPAPVMMQQSKGTGACVPNPWPLPSEREALQRRLQVAPATATAPVVGVTSRPSGWWTVARDGTVNPDSLGNASSRSVVGIAATPAGGGYWVTAGDGGVFAFGDAPFLGRPEGPLNQPVVGIAASPSGQGYWLTAADGGVFAFGDAPFLGRPEGPLNEPVVGIAASPSGQGYWLAAADGGVFAFGDAPFLGRPATLNEPVVGIAGTSSGQGYWLAAGDGGVFAFGDAVFHGVGPPDTVAIATTRQGAYRLATADGTVVSYGG